MAEISEEGDELPRCSTLFLTEDGSQMLFYMTPCAMKTRLRPLIYHGGGHLTSKVLRDSIKLAAPGTASNLCGYISTDYIFDSIKHNKLQDVEKYKMKSSGASVHATSSKSSSIKVSARSRRHGRHKYTHEEDVALIQFVNKHSDYPARGNALYKRAEREKITGHSWQSMRDHYIKVLCKLKGDKNYRHHFSGKSTDSLGQARMTRAQASKVQSKICIDSNDKSAESDADITEDTSGDADQPRMTRAQASKVKEKSDIKNKHAVTEDTHDSPADQESITKATTSKVKEKIGSKNKLDLTDDTKEANGDYLPDVASTDDIYDESTSAEEVDYDKLFDENLLKQAYKSKKKDSEVGSDSTEDEDIAEENRVSSSQETAKRTGTKIQKSPKKEQEKLSDFDGEVVFQDDLKTPSRKLHYDQEELEDKRPLAKRSKRDLESSPDDENTSGKEKKQEEAFLKYYQALRSNLQKLQAELTVPQIIHALLVSSGHIDDTENYIQNGTGKEQWTSKEDKILLSKNKGEISSLAKKRGLHAVVDRMNFMEGIN